MYIKKYLSSKNVTVSEVTYSHSWFVCETPGLRPDWLVFGHILICFTLPETPGASGVDAV